MSDLKSRITVKEASFQITRDHNTNRTAYYNFFTLADAEIEKNKINPVSYFAAMEAGSEIKVEKDCFVCICEYEGDKLVDEAHIYCSANKKPVITWEIIAAPSYEVMNPYKIRIFWEGRGETIRSGHVVLYCRKNENKYAFLTDKMRPENGCAEFIISLPAGYSPGSLEVRFDEDIQLKYQIIRKG